VGYTKESEETKIVAILKDGERVKRAEAGDEVEFVAKSTPFYGESGGQVGDTGVAVAEGIELEVTDTKMPLENLIVHKAKVVRGKIKEGKKITLAIDSERRDRIRCNHTATHLLHRALREVLGEHVKQAGSQVAPDRFRFDFSHFQAMTADEIREVEKRVNAAIRRNYPVLTYELSFDEAVQHGALAFFGEKYGDRVRMIDISGFSKELCGGTHVHAAGDIGMMKIVSESSVAAGVRRVEAVTGRGVEKYLNALLREREDVAKALRSQPQEVAEKARKLAEQVSSLEKELRKARTEGASAGVGDLMGKVREVGGVKLLAARVEAPDRKTLGEWAEKFRDKMGEGVCVLASELEDKVAVVAAVSKSLTPKVHAGNIVKGVSEKLGGKGGGRPDFAQGGGTDASKLDEALKGVEELIK
jgi:alanyl-tRNA synthetase